jgi:SNF2 family DNA or RNA helicase
MIEVKFGIPQGYKERVLAILVDSSTSLRSKLSVLGFNWNPLGKFWTRGDFQPHVISVLESLGVQPSKAVLEHMQKTKPFRNRIYPNNFKDEMLLNYQREALEFCKKSGSGIVALDIGLGKTPCAIAYAELLGLRNLIVCPASLRGQWYNELSKFNKADPQKIVINGTKEKRKEQWTQARECQYVICSYDLLRQGADLAQAKAYLNGGLLICDEIMRVKTKESQRTKAIIEVRKSASFAIGLSGTPVENNLGEFYTILNIASPNFIPSYERFAESFLVRELRQAKGGRSYWQILGEKNVDEFRDIIKPLVIRKEKRECLDLPPASIVVRQTELSKEQKKIEKKLLDLARGDGDNVLKYFTYARENVISPDLLPFNFEDKKDPKNGQTYLNLWEKVSGEYKEDGLEYNESRVQQLIEGKISPDQITLTPRLQEIADILEEIGNERIIIYSPYVKALELVKRCVLKGKPCSMLIGGCEVEKELTEFKIGNNRILLMSSAGEEGHNLQMASLMIIIDKPYNPAKLSQLMGRIERKGQTEPMVFYELNSPSIIEARVNKILDRKEKLSEKVLAQKVMR